MEVDGEGKRESLRDVSRTEEEEEERGEEVSRCLPGAASGSFKPFHDAMMGMCAGVSAGNDSTCLVVVHFFCLKPKTFTSPFILLLIFAVDVGGVTLLWTFVTSETINFSQLKDNKV